VRGEQRLICTASSDVFLLFPLPKLAFAFFVYPSLVLAYLGQGARLIVDRDEVFSNLFFKTIPGNTGGALYW